ncbi:MAG: ribose ABC transporter permease [Synergistaceae bacterium]|nr:ribose ABC transporter permease [Synergistaceae bacterium]
MLKFRVLIIFAVMFTAMSMMSPFFMTQANLLNMARQCSINGLLAVGMTFVIITGGIDLSVGSTLSLSAIIGCSFIRTDSGSPVIVCIAVTLAIGLAIGLANGIMVAFCNIPAFIATLGASLAAAGAALVFNNGAPISNLKDSYNIIGAGKFAGVIPYPIIIFMAVLAVASFVLKKTPYGRYVYALGGNEKAARACGLNTNILKVSVYVIAGLCAAMAGIVLSSRVKTATAIAGQGYEMDAIAAAVLGGTSLSGGVGNTWGTLAGVLIIGLLRNGMTLLNIQSYFQSIIQGAIIVLAVLIDVNIARRKN